MGGKETKEKKKHPATQILRFKAFTVHAMGWLVYCARLLAGAMRMTNYKWVLLARENP